jgi:hypothetical protein
MELSSCCAEVKEALRRRAATEAAPTKNCMCGFI